MNLKSRYKYGFKFGKIEHRFRKYGFNFLVAGVIIYGLCLFFKIDILYYGAYAIFVLALLLETISYIAHFLEKKMMDNIRFGKSK